MNNQLCNNGNNQLFINNHKKSSSTAHKKFNNNQLLLADHKFQLLTNKLNLFNQANTKLLVDNNGYLNNNIVQFQLIFSNKVNLSYYHNNHYNSINYQSMFKNKLDNKIPI